jgi:hypothetical protein
MAVPSRDLNPARKMCRGTASTSACVKIILPLVSHLLLCLLVPITAVNTVVELHGYKPAAEPQDNT